MTTLWEVQAQSTVEAHQQKRYYNRKIGAVNLKAGNMVLVKVDAFKGKRKIKNRWEEETWEVVHHIVTDIPTQVMSPPLKLTSHCVRVWFSLVYGQPLYMGQVYQSLPMQDYLCKR